MEHDNKPTLLGEIKKARASNYDFTRAINEFIDNSLDTDADEIIIEFKNHNNKPDTIKISDNSNSGISTDILSKIFSWTYTRNRLNDDIGEFGTGFKAASVNLGDKITVFTYDKENKLYLKCIADWIDMRNNNNWVPKKIIITKDDYETDNHPFTKGSSFFIEKILFERHTKFTESNIDKIANVYKYILKQKPKIKITVKIDDNEYNLRDKLYYNFDPPAEFKFKTNIQVFGLKDGVACNTDNDELIMVATMPKDNIDEEIKRYVLPIKKQKNGNYKTALKIFNSKNYKCIGFIEFRSCYDIKIKNIHEEQIKIDGIEPE